MSPEIANQSHQDDDIYLFVFFFLFGLHKTKELVLNVCITNNSLLANVNHAIHAAFIAVFTHFLQPLTVLSEYLGSKIFCLVSHDGTSPFIKQINLFSSSWRAKRKSI